MGILIVALVVLINPPALNLCLTFASFSVFSVSLLLGRCFDQQPD